MKKNLFLLMMIAFVATMSLTSCGDACKDVDCGQKLAVPQGECLEGECICNQGFESTGCATEWSAKFVGDFIGKDKSSSTTDPTEPNYNGTFNITPDNPVKISRISETKVKIINMSGFQSSFEGNINKAAESDLTATTLSFTDAVDNAGDKWTGSGVIDATGAFKGTLTVTTATGSIVKSEFDYKK
jgi:hypothetical protein